jgi:hypothetical protein
MGSSCSATPEAGEGTVTIRPSTAPWTWAETDGHVLARIRKCTCQGNALGTLGPGSSGRTRIGIGALKTGSCPIRARA